MAGTIRDIKSYNFGAVTPSSTEVTAQYSDHQLNGEIYKIELFPGKTNASVWIRASGTNETIYYGTSFTSGTTARAYPVISAHNVSGGELTGSVFANVLINALPIYVIGSGFTSGATAFDYVRVFYR